MIETIWEYRAKLYTALLAGLAIFALYSYIESKKEPEDSEFIKYLRTLNASFWPPDVVPHPNLPEPNYPDPKEANDPNNPENWG